MIQVLTRQLRQALVYWAPDGLDGYGQPTYADPVQLACRWEDTVEEIVDATGTRRITKAKVTVGQDVAVGGRVMLGTLEDLDSSGLVPTAQAGAHEVVRFDKTPDARGRQFLRVAYL